MSDTSYNFNYQHLENEYIIFAIDNPNAEHPTVLAERFKLWCAQHHIGVKELCGVWHGEKETSFIVNARYEEQLWNTWCKHQQAILHLGIKRCRDCNRPATMHYRNGLHEAVGDFVTVPVTATADLDGYTYDPDQKLYWSTTATIEAAERSAVVQRATEEYAHG